MILMTATVCLFYYSTVMLIHLNLKISCCVENSSSQLHAFDDLF